MNFSDVALDPQASASLTEKGFRCALVDPADRDTAAGWARAVARGFHESEPDAESLDRTLDMDATRRSVGVWDDAAEEPEVPVGTVSSWATTLILPGRTVLPVCAISAVTVSQAHRRRGIARDLMNAQLRTASAAGLPLAALTVSEATIYRRFGFGPATWSTEFTIDTKRTTWTGPRPDGRVDFVPVTALTETGREVFERALHASPGQLTPDDGSWPRLMGAGRGPEQTQKLRAVCYRDAAGRMQGFALYRIERTMNDHRLSECRLHQLVAATDDAASALWRFLVELDLVDTVVAPLRAVDDQVRWQLSDPRALRVTSHRDHLWLRLLDVEAALAGRGYAADGRAVFDIADASGFADGRFLLNVGAGHGRVERIESVPDGAPRVEIDVADLSSLYLGGASAVTLRRAGRLTEHTAGAAEAVDALLCTPVAPWLSYWF